MAASLAVHLGTGDVSEMMLSLKAAFLVFVCGGLSREQAASKAQPVTFHVEGTITSAFDSLPAGIDDKGVSIPFPRTQVTFEGEQGTKTVTVDGRSFYETDLPLGLYRMTAKSPTLKHQWLTQYVRLFRAKSAGNIVMNGALYTARLSCDVVGDEEDFKDACGGEDSVPIPAKDGTPFKLQIQYPHRQLTRHGYIYSGTKIGDRGAPVSAAYNLFSLTADTVTYTANGNIATAAGNVVTEDGLGTTHHYDSCAFRFEDGQAIPVP